MPGESLDVDQLYVTRCFVNEGSRWKRLRPAPMGRAFRYQKRTAHIVVAVAEHHVAAQERAAAAEAEARGAQGREGRGAQGAQSAHRIEESRGEKAQEVAGGDFGAEDTPVRVPARLQQAVEVPLVCGPRLRRPAHEDIKLRRELKERLRSAGVSSIDIERAANKLVVRIYTARPGIIIGRKGAEIDKLKNEIQKRTKREVHIDIQEVHRPELDAQLVAESIALQLEKRVAFRRAMRKSVDSALRFGCKGIKVRVGGRLNGAEIARTEWYLQGRLPLQTLRADIDFGFAQAYTTYGVIGVKCWIYQGENIPARGQQAAIKS